MSPCAANDRENYNCTTAVMKSSSGRYIAFKFPELNEKLGSKPSKQSYLTVY